MTQNNNLSVLPWYKNIEEQNHRKSYAFGNIYPLFTPKDKLLPFQIMRKARSEQITEAKLFTIDGIEFADLKTPLEESGLKLINFPDFNYDVIVYPGNFPMPINTPPGQYYAKLSDGVETWFSEVFTIVTDLHNYTKIEWYDLEDMVFDQGRIVYKNPTFKNVLYFIPEIGKPEYTFDEQGQDRDGFFFPEKQISEKTYKITVLAPEYLCDVMRFIRMSDIVKVTDKYDRIYNCDTFLITPKFQTQGDIASVEIEFQTDTVVKKLGKGVIIGNNGDFNNDFNNDFDNKKEI
jgi:hypothetical protein